MRAHGTFTVILEKFRQNEDVLCFTRLHICHSCEYLLYELLVLLFQLLDMHHFLFS